MWRDCETQSVPGVTNPRKLISHTLEDGGSENVPPLAFCFILLYILVFFLRDILFFSVLVKQPYNWSDTLRVTVFRLRLFNSSSKLINFACREIDGRLYTFIYLF